MILNRRVAKSRVRFVVIVDGAIDKRWRFGTAREAFRFGNLAKDGARQSVEVFDRAQCETVSVWSK